MEVKQLQIYLHFLMRYYGKHFPVSELIKIKIKK
jgi:hypothetical protein